MELLKCPNGVIFLDKKGSRFVVKDFCENKRILKANKYIVGGRRAIKFFNEWHWIYTCSCNEEQQQLVSSLKKEVSATYQEFMNSSIIQCIHLQALDLFFEPSGRADDDDGDDDGDNNNDDDDDDVSDMSCPFFAISEKEIFVEIEDGNPGIVTSDERGMCCATCRYGVHTCQHVQEVKLAFDRDTCPDFVLDFVEWSDSVVHSGDGGKRPEFVHQCKSYKDVSFESPPNYSKFLFGWCHHNPIPEVNIASLSAAAELAPTQKCPFCGEQGVLVNGQSSEKTLYTKFNRINVKVIDAKIVVHQESEVMNSNVCQHYVPFDGSDKCILNMSDFLIGYDVLRDYMHLFLNGRQPLRTYYKVWCKHQKEAGHIEEGMLSYAKFRHACYQLLQIYILHHWPWRHWEF